MNILLVKDNDDNLRFIFNEIEKEHKIQYISAPEQMDEAYLAEFMSAIKDNSIDKVFSLDFYREISLACGAMNICYTVWIIEGYCKHAYDYSINNSWNEVFVADHVLYDEMRKMGIQNINFLPLCPTPFAEKSGKGNGLSKDILVWGDPAFEAGISFTKIDELKDSSKGYIYGMCLSRKHNLVAEPLYDRFPDYVKDDIEKKYPLDKDSMESIGHKYDFEFLFPEIDRHLMGPYLIRLRNDWDNYERITFASDAEFDGYDDTVVKISRSEIIENDYKELDDFKVIIYLPPLTDNGIIPWDLWNILRRGSFVMCANQIDFACFEDDKPFTYKNTRELEHALRYYLKNDYERNQYALRTQNKAIQLGTIGSRIKAVFG